MRIRVLTKIIYFYEKFRENILFIKTKFPIGDTVMQKPKNEVLRKYFQKVTSEHFVSSLITMSGRMRVRW